jgi:hypothetical protein
MIEGAVQIIKAKLNTILMYVFLGLFGLSLAGNIYFLMGKGIQIYKTITTTSSSTSNSYASSGALSINILGQQQYYNGKYQLKRQIFSTSDKAFIFAQSLNICDWELVKMVESPQGYEVWYQEFILLTDKKEGVPIVKSKTVKE